MKLANGVLHKILGRPFVLIYAMIISLVYCVVDMVTPIIAILFGFSTMGEGDLLGTAISLLQLVLSPVFLLKALPWIVGGIVIGAFLASLILPGYFYIVYRMVEEKERHRGEFIAGLKQYFKKFFAATLTVFGLCVLFALFIAVVAIPALFTTWSVKAGKTELFGMAVLLDILTVAVMFFAFMFFRLYTFYWYPAIFSFSSCPFKNGKRIIDRHFWPLVGRWVILDVIFIAFESLFLFMRYQISLGGDENIVLTAGLFAGKFIFSTAFLSSVISFIFASFKTVRELGNE